MIIINDLQSCSHFIISLVRLLINFCVAYVEDIFPTYAYKIITMNSYLKNKGKHGFKHTGNNLTKKKNLDRQKSLCGWLYYLVFN